MLDSRKDHVKFWRPQMLLMVSNPRSSCPLIVFVNDMKKSGLYVIGHVKAGKDFSELLADPTQDEYTHWLSLVDHLKVKAFVELTVAETVRSGLHHLVRISGMGAMKPNTIVFGFYDGDIPQDFFLSPSSPYATARFQGEGTEGEVFSLRGGGEKSVSPQEYVHMMSDVLRMKRNLCLCRHFSALDKQAIKSNVYRPSFKYFSWHTALIGLVGTLIMMFVINPIYSLCSIVLCVLLILLLHVFSPARSAEWGSISQALIFHQVRKYLLMLDSRKDHVKFWRPQMLLMVSNPRSSCPLIVFVNDMKK
ncbi:solute carrier family 12 member 9-like [Diaphorina citri]|uniref:Solute carrier family 12 member 9-like n=1 Tax=Diaphorina citri TaxID=121845 RepID=A0A3Q0JF53_DIACI|nr:solute carrier family 12 member 9-like [Diaphorina citri]